MLPIEVERGRPPFSRSIFEFNPVAQERIEAMCPPEDRTRLDLQGIWLLHVVVVRNKVRPGYPFLSQGKGRQKAKSCKETNNGLLYFDHVSS